MDKYKFVEDMLNERYKKEEKIYLRKVHLWLAKCSMNFRNDLGKYYWHNDNLRLSKPKEIILL